jgi:hypothetical protein
VECKLLGMASHTDLIVVWSGFVGEFGDRFDKRCATLTINFGINIPTRTSLITRVNLLPTREESPVQTTGVSNRKLTSD